jgi:TetR/AcrR family transcriptional regulator, transcriptional repressor for nem operon
MPEKKKIDTKLTILEHGARLVHLNGYHNTGIKDVLLAANIPKGSFYFYFQSKEDFGLQLIDFFLGMNNEKTAQSLQNTDLKPLERLKVFYDDFLHFFEENECKLGCPIGNLSLELGDINETFRLRLRSGLDVMKNMIEECLKDAVKQNDIHPDISTSELAEYLVNSWEGALISMKASKSTQPLKIFDYMVFNVVLR